VMVHDETLVSQPRLKRLLERQPFPLRGGERLQLYERDDGELALLGEYKYDENVTYLLRRLNDTAGRFEPLFKSKDAFAAFFPLITTRTDLDQAKMQQATTQLSMF
jgi:hypothetical protein